MHKEAEISSQKCEINQLKQQMMMKVEKDGCDSSRSVQVYLFPYFAMKLLVLFSLYYANYRQQFIASKGNEI